MSSLTDASDAGPADSKLNKTHYLTKDSLFGRRKKYV